MSSSNARGSFPHRGLLTLLLARCLAGSTGCIARRGLCRPVFLRQLFCALLLLFSLLLLLLLSLVLLRIFTPVASVRRGTSSLRSVAAVASSSLGFLLALREVVDEAEALLERQLRTRHAGHVELKDLLLQPRHGLERLRQTELGSPLPHTDNFSVDASLVISHDTTHTGRGDSESA